MSKKKDNNYVFLSNTYFAIFKRYLHFCFQDALESSSATLLEKEAVIFKLKNRMENQEKELKV